LSLLLDGGSDHVHSRLPDRPDALARFSISEPKRLARDVDFILP
jgi:hypothetical protein